jgi:hypothetical protein
MLKTVSSIVNAIGALNYKGTWDANANSPALASSVGTKGDYYVVGTAGSTTLNGISNWGVGDWAAYNGSAWQRVEGGANLNGVDLSVSGTSTLSGLTASTALALNASKQVVSVTNTGTGNNVLDTSPSIATPTLTGDVQMSTGNLVIGTSGKGIDFSATPGTGTSELLSDYEEGTWTPVLSTSTPPTTPFTMDVTNATYTKVGRMVNVRAVLRTDSVNTAGCAGVLVLQGLPFASASQAPIVVARVESWGVSAPAGGYVEGGATEINLQYRLTANGAMSFMTAADLTAGAVANQNVMQMSATYYV